MAKFRKRSHSKALAVRSVRPVIIRQTRVVKPKHRRRRGGGGAGMGGLGNVAIAAIGMSYMANNVETVKSLANKIPGSQTFGPAGALGLAALAIDKFIYRNKWLRLAGVAGVVIAAVTVGTKGSSFQWMGALEARDDSRDVIDIPA